MAEIIRDINKSLCFYSHQRLTDTAKTQEETHKEWVSYFHNRVPLDILLLNLLLRKISISLFPFSLGHFALFLDIVRRQELNIWSVTSLLRSAGGTHS